MNEKIDRKPVCDCRYYGIFAVNRQNPNIILGYVENSFSMGWSPRFVNVNPAFRMNAVDVKTDKLIRELHKDRSPSEFLAWFRDTNKSLYRKGMSAEDAMAEYRKKIREMESRSMLAQHVWNDLANTMRVPAGYDIKVFRLNSSKCPVDVDLRYRTAYNRGQIPTGDKWKYRNAVFIVKALYPGRSVSDFYPTVKSVLAVDADCVEFKNYEHYAKRTFAFSELRKKGVYASRSEKKILKKQRINSFAANERAQGGQALPNGRG